LVERSLCGFDLLFLPSPEIAKATIAKLASIDSTMIFLPAVNNI
jgi:hypothetical protein